MPEKVSFPEWFTPEMIAACVGMTQVEIDAQDDFMLQNGCIPPRNCPNCGNTGCYTVFRETMIAGPEEIG